MEMTKTKERAIYGLFKKITKGNEKNIGSRNVLKYIQVKEGVAVATDGHRLLKVEGFINNHRGESYLLGKTGEQELEEKHIEYPDTNRLMPLTTSFINFNVKEMYDLLKSIPKVKRGMTVINFKFDKEENKITITPQHSNVEPIKINAIGGNEDFFLHFEMKYMIDGLLMFKQLGNKEVMLEHTGSHLRPFTLTGEEKEILYLVCPVRVN